MSSIWNRTYIMNLTEIKVGTCDPYSSAVRMHRDPNSQN